MTEKARKAWSSYWWGALGTVGLALIVAALLLVVSSAPGEPGVPVVHAQDTSTPTPTNTPTITPTPTVTPTPNPYCQLNIRKTDDPSTVPEGGEIEYTITVENEADSGECEDLTVTDTIPNDTDCVSATVEDTPSGFDIDEDDITGCDSSGNVEWDTNDELDNGDEVVLKMVVELEDDAEEGDTITNEVCADSSGAAQDCDEEKTKVGEAPTATPRPTSTPYVPPTIAPTLPPPVLPPPVLPPPVIAPLVAPPTGSGSASGGGGMNALALALGLAGGALLLASGTGLWVRRPR